MRAPENIGLLRTDARANVRADAGCASPNALYVSYCYAKLSREGAARQLRRAYAVNALVRNFYGVPVELRAPLLSHVGHVVGLRAKKKVVRIHAGRVIAPMQDMQTVWYGAAVQFVGQAVSADGLPLRISDTPITERVATLCPKPAIINTAGLKTSKEAGAQ